MRVTAGVTPNWMNVDVCVDGVSVHGCLEADDVEGWADIYVGDDADGRTLTADDCFRTYRLTGTVTFVPATDAARDP